MQYNLIVACDPNGVIGANGQLPWHFPEDLQFFKETTMGHTVIMGRKTWESLPKRHLPGRQNIVISKSLVQSFNHNPDRYEGVKYLDGNVMAFDSFNIWTSYCNRLVLPTAQVFFIGGASIYKWALENVRLDNIYVTEMTKTYEGDTFIPIPIFKHFPMQGNHEDFQLRPNILSFNDNYTRFCLERIKKENV